MLRKIDPCPGLGRHDDPPEAAVAGLLPAIESLGKVQVVPLRVEAESPGVLALRACAAQVSALDTPGAAPLVPCVGDLDEAPLLER